MIKMNQKMADRVGDLQLDITKVSDFPVTFAPGDLISAGESIFFRSEFERAGHISPSEFPDRTGLECFINHLHIRLTDEMPMASVIGFLFELRKMLEAFCAKREFLIILSITGEECTVRFHEHRPQESWLADDLEAYLSEAILVLTAEAPNLQPATGN
jgi:hypothetical protein